MNSSLCLKKVSLAAFAFFCLLPLGAQTRFNYSINTNWQFHKGDTTQESSWTRTSIPHTWNIDDTRDDEPGYYRGVGYYKQSLFVPGSWSGKKCYLFFEGANQVTILYVNGEKVGEHIGGYTAFRFDITPYLNFEADNHLLVQVDNGHNADIPPLEADFTFFGGIYRDVLLEVTDQVHFDQDNFGSAGVFFQTPNVSNESADLVIKGAIRNESNSKRSLQLKAIIKNPGGQLVGSTTSKITLNEGKSLEFILPTLTINNPQLWSPAAPKLYTVEVTISDRKSGEVLDSYVHSTGFRWYGFNALKQFTLNGEVLPLRGINRHQDYEGLGFAVPDELHEKDIRLIKEMGANFIRLAHYPQDPSVLKACDRLGLIAWEEIPIVDEITVSDAFTQNSENMLREMIRQHYNHPSLIMVGYMNEVLIGLRKNDKTPGEVAAYIPKVKALNEHLEKVAKEEDPSRVTVIAYEAKYKRYVDAEMIGITDVSGWNLYPGWYGGKFQGFGNFLDKFHKEYPDQPILVSEYGAGADPRVYAQEPTRFDFSIEYQTLYHQNYLDIMESKPFLAGGALWLFSDFSSEARKDTWPHINNKGLVTHDRELKNAYKLYHARWSGDEVLHFARSASSDAVFVQANEEGKYIYKARAFTNLKSANLWINGRSIGPGKQTGNTIEWRFEVKEGPLQLMAESLDGKVSANTSLDVHLVPMSLSEMKVGDQININLGAHFTFYDAVSDQTYLPSLSMGNVSYGPGGGNAYMMNDWRIGTNVNIMETELDPIYQTQQIGLDKCILDVPSGSYELTLHFANLEVDNQGDLVNDLSVMGEEVSTDQSGIFDVLINDQAVLNQVDLMATKAAFQHKIHVDTKGNEGIKIFFQTKKGLPALNALQLRKVH